MVPRRSGANSAVGFASITMTDEQRTVPANPHSSHIEWNCRQALTSRVLLPRVSQRGRRCRRRMRERFTWTSVTHEQNCDRATLSIVFGPASVDDTYRVYAPLIRLRHLLPPQETAGGEGLSAKQDGERFK